MRILIIIPYFYPAQSFGGPVRIAFDVGKELVRQGHHVTVYTSDAKDLNSRLHFDKKDIEGMRVYYLRNLSMLLVEKSNLFVTPKLYDMIKAESFDIIHTHEYRTYQNIIVHKIAKENELPYVLQAHGSLPTINRHIRKRLYDCFFGRKILRSASKVIALTQMEANYCKSFGVSEERIAVIPNAIDLAEYAVLPRKGNFKRKFNIPSNNKIVLYIGRLHRTKRIDYLIRAYAQLIRVMRCNDITLVIAGPDDGYLGEAMSLAHSLGISESVFFLGFISREDKIKAFVDAEVFVVPSFYGFPVTFLEACAVGTPIVTTELGDVLEWVDGEVGLVAQSTYSHLAEAIYMIITNSQLRKRFSRNCKQLVQTRFSIDKIINNFLHVYEDSI